VLQKESTARQYSNGLAASLSAMRSAISARVAPASLPRAPQPFMPPRSAQNPRIHPAVPSQTRPPVFATPTTQPIARQSSSSAWTSSQPSSGQTSQRQVVSENIRAALVTSRPATLASTENNNDLNKFLYQQPQRSILDDDISVVDFSDPFMQPIKWEEYATESQNSGRLGSEGMQPLSEVATRSFHNTMNQHAPKPKPNPFAGRLPGLPPNPIKAAPAIVNEIQVVDPLPEFVKEINQSFATMMERAQGFRGEVEVQAEFGRVLLNNIHRKHITSRESTDTLHSTEQLQSMLLDEGPGFDTFFTNILTTAPGEIPYLLNLTDRDGKELWDKEKVSVWSVKYELCFADKAAPETPWFTIEIDAETFVTQIKSWRSLGNIFIHGLGRHWDFRIAANGYESGWRLEEEYSGLATAIELSLHIP